jgi:dynein heavy chain
LRRISDIVEEWIKLQVNWMYLQPIFDSADISKQLPGESKKFKNVDIFWRSNMARAKDLGNVLKICQT